MNSKVIIAGIVGGIAYFLLGWLIFGILLSGSMDESMSEGMKAVYRGEDNYLYWAFIVGNMAWGFFLAIILNKFGVKSFMKGALNGLWIGLLMVIGFDFGMYAQFTLFDLNMIGMDMIMSPIFTAIIAGIVGLMLGMGKKSATA